MMRLKKNYQFVLIYLLLVITSATAQNISRLYINDGKSKPLMENDNGISFGFRTDSQGDLLALFKINNSVAFKLLDTKLVNAGPGLIKVRSSSLIKMVDCESRKTLSYSLYLAHIDFLTNDISENELPLNLQILKPHGCRLLDIPPPPELLQTNLRKKQVKFSSALGLIAGGAVVTKGLYDLDKYSESSENADSAKVERAGGFIIVGAVISLLSLVNLHEFVPDNFRNNLNKQKNNSLNRSWNLEVENIRTKNGRIRLTYTIIIG